ncbi:MAG: helix-turn-helix domain-containing protein [Polyangiaceae bacterium]
MRPPARRLAFVVFPGFQILDVTGPIAAFEIAARFAPGAYALSVVGARAGRVSSSSGVALDAAPATHRTRWHTILVSGGEGTRAPIEPALRRFLLGAPARVERIASVCSGAFLLAALGLLDGRRATTHWTRCASLARRFPAVRVEPDRIFTRDGPVWTSAGITAGIDLALAMIGEDLGEDVARRTARQLVVYHRRPGGQSQFSELLELDRGEPAFAELLGWARARLREDLGVARLAKRAGMSPRNFARRFVAATGVTPARAIERVRVEVARELVERARGSIEEAAERAGFGDPERMRRAFVRAFGQPPQALRRAARSR